MNEINIISTKPIVTQSVDINTKPKAPEKISKGANAGPSFVETFKPVDIQKIADFSEVEFGGKKCRIGTVNGAQVAVSESFPGVWTMAHKKTPLVQNPNNQSEFKTAGLKGGGMFFSKPATEQTGTSPTAMGVAEQHNTTLPLSTAMGAAEQHNTAPPSLRGVEQVEDEIYFTLEIDDGAPSQASQPPRSVSVNIPNETVKTLPPIVIPKDNEPADSPAWNLFVASVSQTVATALTFGAKAFVEAATETALTAMMKDSPFTGDIDEQQLNDTIKVMSNLAGGAYVGFVHNAVGKSVQSYLKHRLDGESFKDTNPSIAGKELNNFATVTLPVFGAFGATYAAGAAGFAASQAAPDAGAWMHATMRCAQSMLGGAIQGPITHALQKSMSDYESVKPKEMAAKDIYPAFKEALSDQFAGDNKQNILSNGVGKVLGGVFGMIGASFAGSAARTSVHDALGNTGPIASDSAAQAAGSTAGLMTFLTSWFTGIHAGSVAGQISDAEAEAYKANSNSRKAAQQAAATASPVAEQTTPPDSPFAEALRPSTPLGQIEALRPEQYEVVEIKRDGDCLFHAVSDQLGKQISAREIRSSVANFLRENQTELLQNESFRETLKSTRQGRFFSNPESTMKSLIKFANTPGQWNHDFGDLMPPLISMALNRDIAIYRLDTSNANLTLNNHHNLESATFHEAFLGQTPQQSAGSNEPLRVILSVPGHSEHYDSVVLKESNADREAEPTTSSGGSPSQTPRFEETRL